MARPRISEPGSDRASADCPAIGPLISNRASCIRMPRLGLSSRDGRVEENTMTMRGQDSVAVLRDMFAVCANERRMQEADALDFAILAIQSQQDGAQGGEAAGFGIGADDVAALLGGCLKPEEISGDPAIQHDRVHELICWFARLTRKSANPKWTASHACELAYYIATNAGNRHIDLGALRNASFKEGANITPNERAMLERVGAIAPQATSGAVDDAMVERALGALGCRIIDGRQYWSEDERRAMRDALTAALAAPPAEVKP